MTTSSRRKSENRLYALLIKPKQSVQNLRNREMVLNVVLVSTGLLMLVLFVLLLLSFFAFGNTQVASRIVVAAGGVGFAVTLLWLSRRLHYRLAAYLLTLFYFVLAAGSVASWGIGNTFGILLLAMAITLAGILLNARHGLYMAAAASAVLFWVQSSVEAGWITPQTQNGQAASIGDAVGYTVVFAMIATISWLFGGRMEHSLVAAEAAEEALSDEKRQLQVRLKKYAERLQQAQMDEMRQLYQFAEVGQLSTSLLHDLANHLSVLNLEIDSMRDRKHAESLSRSRDIVAQLDVMLDEVRNRLAGQKTEKAYNLADVISEAVVRCLRNYAGSGLQVEWHAPANIEPYNLVGDPLKCGQIVSILLRNAHDAAVATPLPAGERPRIAIGLKRSGDSIQISVTDWGTGIPRDKREEIFRPAYTTKRAGMGIGLYLARQMVTTEFSGTLKLAHTTDRTEFIVSLPAHGS